MRPPRGRGPGIRAVGRLVAAMLALATVATSPAPAQTPAPGARDQLVMASAIGPITISPFESAVISPDRQIVFNVYDPLVDLNAKGEVVPALAVSWTRPEPRTIEMELRRGVVFQGGERFTARDVKFTFDTLLEPATKHKMANNVAFIERVEVVNDHRVRIVTKRPEATGLRKLNRIGIASAAFAGSETDLLARRANGTGPYRLVEWVKDSHVALEAFAGSWRGQPAIRRIVWRPIKEDAARVAALVAGEVDVAENVPVDLAPLVERSRGAELRTVPSQRSYWLMMVNKPGLPTARVEVRQAINHAIDRDELNAALFGGRALTMATAVRPATLGYNSRLRWPHDVARARALLAKAGYPDGLALGLHASDGRYARDRELSQALAGQLARAGIRVKVDNYEMGQFSDRIFRKATEPLVLYAFSDPDHDRTSTFGISHRTGELWSVTAYPRLDELITRAETTLDDRDRASVLREIQDWTMQNAPAAYLFTLVDSYGVNRALSWTPRADEVIRWREASFR